MAAGKLVALLAKRSPAPALDLRHAVLAAEPTDAVLAGQLGRAPRPERHAGLLLAWPRDEAERAAAETELAPLAHWVHTVDEVVHWDELDGASDALVLVYVVRRRPDLSFADFSAHYRERHAPLARVHHPGIARYVQNFRTPAESGAPFDAVSELWFASEGDARTRFYRDDESRRVIAEDVARFVELRGGAAFAARPAH